MKEEDIIIGQIALSFHKASAAVFRGALLYLGYERIRMVSAPHEEMFEKQRQGEVDLLISAWLPGSHGKYAAPYENEVDKFAPIYEPYCIWGVPDYIPASDLDSIDDLKNASVLANIRKDIQGIGMGAGISRFSVEMLDAYELKEKGYTFTSNEEKTFFDFVERSIAKREWFVIPLWHPQYLNHMFRIRALKDPKGLLRGKDYATPLLRKDARRKIKEADINALSNIYLGNTAVAEMDFLINKKNLSPDEAAEHWIEEHYKNIKNFIRA